MPPAPHPTKPLSIGVLGCANIARQFIRDVRDSPRVVITAVASRNVETARAFATENGVATSHGSYEALLADPEVDAIYLPLPNSLHAVWAVKSAAAGKHVLCEKPLTLTRADAEAMFAAAARHKTVLLEAYPFWFQPHFQALLDLVRGGAIGTVRSVQASFGFTVGNPSSNIRLKSDLGGGALLDAGSYPASLIRAVMGTAPTRVTAVASMTESGVDMSTMALLEYADGRRAQLSCAMDGANHRHATVVGSNGTLYTEYLNHTSDQPGGNAVGYLPNSLLIRRGVAQTIPFEALSTPVGSGFRFAAEAFASLVHGTQSAAIAAEFAQASVDIAATLEAISASAACGAPVVLAP